MAKEYICESKLPMNMKRIKRFELFLENEEKKTGYKLFYFKTEANEDYGYPILSEVDEDDLYRRNGSWESPNSIDELHDEYVNANNGPIHGSDGWESLNYSIQKYQDAKDQNDEEEMAECLEKIEDWLSDFGLDDADAERVANEPDYYDEMTTKYINDTFQQWKNAYYPFDSSWNFLCIDLNGGGEYSNRWDDNSIDGNLWTTIASLIGSAVIPLAYSNDSDYFHILTSDNEFIKTKFTKSNSPEKIASGFIADPESHKMVSDMISKMENTGKKNFLPKAPLDILDAYFKENPLDLYMIADHPQLKDEVLKRTGLKDFSRLGQTIDKGIL
jgi:hypothetical protein